MNIKKLLPLFVLGKKRKPRYLYHTVKIVKKVPLDISDKGEMPEPDIEPNLRCHMRKNRWEYLIVECSPPYYRDHHVWYRLSKEEAAGIAEQLANNQEVTITHPLPEKKMATAA